MLVAGGKYTTYRLMARDAVDAVVHALDWRAPPSCTDRVPLAGADGYVALWNARHRLALSSGLHVARIEHLLRRYGSLTPEVLDLVAAEPGLGRPLTGADDYLRAEIVYAASHEGARHLDDVLGRRTHIAIETADRGMAALAEIASLMAGPLRWDARQTAREVAHYRAGAAAERASQEAEHRRRRGRDQGDGARTSCPCWTRGTATAWTGWAAVWPGEWEAAATRLRPCPRPACSPASSRPPTRSISAITWAPSASGWPCRTPMTPSTAWLTCTRSRCRRTRRSSGAGPGSRPRSCSRPAWIPAGASCSSRATWPSTPSSPGC